MVTHKMYLKYANRLLTLKPEYDRVGLGGYMVLLILCLSYILGAAIGEHFYLKSDRASDYEKGLWGYLD